MLPPDGLQLREAASRRFARTFPQFFCAAPPALTTVAESLATHADQLPAELFRSLPQQGDDLGDSAAVFLRDRDGLAFVFDRVVRDRAGDGSVGFLRNAHDLRSSKYAAPNSSNC